MDRLCTSIQYPTSCILRMQAGVKVHKKKTYIFVQNIWNLYLDVSTHSLPDDATIGYAKTRDSSESDDSSDSHTITVYFHISSSFILKTSIFPHSARVRLIPEHCPFRMQTKRLHIILHTFIPSLPPSTRTPHPCHHHISTGRHSIILTLTFLMPKPPQSTPPHHRINTLDTQKTVQIHTVFPILQRHSAHSSHHHPFCPLQTLQIRFLHRPGLSPICQYTLDTSPVYPSLYDAPLAIRIGDNSLNFAQAHLTLALAASYTPPPAPSVSPK